MKKVNIYWGCAICILLSYVGFILIEHVFTISPDVWSGNGNLGILIMLLFAPVFICSYFFTYRVARELSTKAKKLRVVLLTLAVISSALLVFPIINYVDELIIALDGTPSDPESKIYRFGWFNQYTNGIYFNGYTFLMSHLLAIIIGILSTFFKK